MLTVLEEEQAAAKSSAKTTEAGFRVTGAFSFRVERPPS
jgi:hypothetical protein